jgi:hypothetical protein
MSIQDKYSVIPNKYARHYLRQIDRKKCIRCGGKVTKLKTCDRCLEIAKSKREAKKKPHKALRKPRTYRPSKYLAYVQK